MIGRFVLEVAGLAVGRPNCLVVENRAAPGGCAVTQRTLPVVMIGGLILHVAGLAITDIRKSMIEVDVSP